MEKKAYHHGELRQALIDASRRLVHDCGADGFSLADACRLAGVSTAAPYRHFADKHEVLSEVAAQGFRDMTARAKAATTAFPVGSAARIEAVGRVYLDFAVAEPALFRLMFGPKDNRTGHELVAQDGHECFAYVVEEVVRYCDANRLGSDARMIALQLWTFVHGAACLVIDGGYAKVAPDVAVDRLMTEGAARLLAPVPRAAG